MIYSSNVRLPSFHLYHRYGNPSELSGIVPYKEGYRVFYRYCLTDSQSGSMSLGYQQTRDLIRWERHGLAITPKLLCDRTGSLGGCAVAIDDKRIVLYYASDRYLNKPDKHHRRCIIMAAISKDGVLFSNKGIVIEPPDTSICFRDPKVFYYDTRWWMIVGGGNKNEEGEIYLYSSINFFNWYFETILFRSIDGQEGQVYSNPELIKIEDKWIMSFTKKELIRGVEKIQAGYMIGQWLTNANKFQPETGFIRYDHGVDFHDPKFIQSEDKQYVIGSMLPHGYARGHTPTSFSQYTLIREITLNKDKNRLVQKPIMIFSSRDKLLAQTYVLNNEEKVIDKINFRGKYLSLGLTVKHQNERVGLRLGAGFKVYYDYTSMEVVVERDYPEYKTVDRRVFSIPSDKQQMYLHFFIDNSSVEIFDDELTGVFTYQFYPNCNEDEIHLFAWGGLTTLLIDVYEININST